MNTRILRTETELPKGERKAKMTTGTHKAPHMPASQKNRKCEKYCTASDGTKSGITAGHNPPDPKGRLLNIGRKTLPISKQKTARVWSGVIPLCYAPLRLRP